MDRLNINEEEEGLMYICSGELREAQTVLQTDDT